MKQDIMKRQLSTRLRHRRLMVSFLGLVAIVSLTLATTFSLHDASAETFESAQGISFTFNPTVKITITGGTGASSDGLTIDNLTPGDYKDSNIITVTAGSNSPLGYTLSSTVGSSTYNSTELRRNGTETANKFTNLSSNKASLSAFDPGYWGYSYSTNSDSTWISGDIVSGTSAGYNGLPIYTTASPIKLINSSTPSESSVQFKIGARATSSQTAGTYSNVVNFIGVAKVVTTNYTINYNANAGSDTVTNMPTPNPLQGTDTTGNAAIQISSNVPVRENYMFKGWCTSQTSDDTCSSDVVQPGGLVALNPGTSSRTATITKTIYAMWRDNTPKIDYCITGGIPDSSCMQKMTTCPTTAVSVTDARDGEQYKVQQLADGKCWLLDNLRLDLTNSTILNNLTTSNTHADASSLTSLKYGNRSAGNQYATGPFTAWNSSSAANSYCVAKANADYKDTPATISYGVGSGEIGVYYNYCAASAGSYCYGVGTTAGTSTGNATYDLCPYGWRMPTGGGSGSDEYKALYAAYGNKGADFKNALSTPITGFFKDGSAVSQDSFGAIWSSTRSNDDSMYRLYVYTSSGVNFNSYYRRYGHSLRCLLGS